MATKKDGKTKLKDAKVSKKKTAKVKGGAAPGGAMGWDVKANVKL